MRAFRHDDAGAPPERWADLAGAPLEVSSIARLVVVAAHPDDESLGAGGLLAACARRGIPASVVLLTDGEGSHPSSPTHDAHAMAERRRAESVAAAAAVGVDAGHLHRVGLADGGIADAMDDAVAAIVDAVGDGRGTLLVAPYRRDGHPDHEAAGRAASVAAERTDARLLEYPIWLLHAGAPADLDDVLVTHVPLAAEDVRAKAAAIAAHASQVAPLSDAAGDETMLGEHVLAHFRGDRELLLAAPAGAPDDRLDRLHRSVEEPWGADERWYEERRRALVLATLPARRPRRILEVGCSTGVLTAALADRADEVVAIDASPAALERAAERTRDLPVQLVEGRVPDAWAEGAFDAIVVSEVGYFLSPAALDALVERVAASLAPGGAVVLAHWRHPIRGWPLDAEAVHRGFDREGIPPLAASYRDDDVAIELRCVVEAMPEPGA